MSADARLKSFIDRVLRLKEDSDYALGWAIEDRVARLDYVLSPLAAIDGRRSIALDRAYQAGGRLLGVKGEVVRNRVRAVRRRGDLQAALGDLESWMPGPVWNVPQLDGDLLGFVYAMVAIDYPGIVKIGFTRSPRQRVKRLQREFRVRLEIVHYAPATEFDEHLIQHSMAEYGLAGEWFDLNKAWEQSLPAVRLYTPERMWNEIREAA